MRPELVTFDCYGTLIDWDRGIARAFRDEAARRGVAVREDQVLAAYHEVESAVEEGEYLPYRDVLRETARKVADRLGLPLPSKREEFLVESLPSWPPFPDTNPALDTLNAAGYRLGILSNTDDDLLADTLRHFTVAFDLMVTSQQLKSYKPSPAHFRRALEEVDGEPERMLHVASGYAPDVRPALRLGIPVVWVNRTGRARPEGPAPTAEVSDLLEVVDWISERYPAVEG